MDAWMDGRTEGCTDAWMGLGWTESDRIGFELMALDWIGSIGLIPEIDESYRGSTL